MRTTRSKLSQFVHSVLHMPRYSVARVAIPVALGLAVAFQAGPSIAAFAAENHVIATVSDTLAATTAALTGSAANPENQSGGGTNTAAVASPVRVTSAKDLSDAISNAPTDGSELVVQLQGNSEGKLDLGADTFQISGNKNLVLEDSGSKVFVSFQGKNTDNAMLFQISDGAKLTVQSGADGTDSEGNPTSYNLNYSRQTTRFARVNKGGSLTIKGGAFENNVVDGYGAVFQNGWVWATGGLLTIEGGLFKGNVATVVGGGVIFTKTEGTDRSQTIIDGGLFDSN